MHRVSDGVFEGGCLCGATRYRVSGEATSRCWCHCQSCRLASGSPFVAWVTFPATNFQLLQGDLASYRSSPPVLRGFCPTCGTALTYQSEDRAERLDVAVATLDDGSLLKPLYHIWVSDQVSWVSIDDGLPQFPEWRTKEVT